MSRLCFVGGIKGMKIPFSLVFDWASQRMSWRIFAEYWLSLFSKNWRASLSTFDWRLMLDSLLLGKAQTHLPHLSLPHPTNVNDTASLTKQPCAIRERAWPRHCREISSCSGVAFVALCPHDATTSCDEARHGLPLSPGQPAVPCIERACTPSPPWVLLVMDAWYGR
jgi:hypothetical protein